MSLANFLSGAGDIIGNFIPGANIVLKGAGTLAGLIGGSTGKKIQMGAEMLADGMQEAGKIPLNSEQQVQMQQLTSNTKIEMAKIKFADKKLGYDDASGGREVIKTALISDDPIVRQARPRMMVKLGNAAIIYTVATPIFIGVCAMFKIDKEIISLITNMILWQGATLWTAFTTSFTGYTVARSADKKMQRDVDLGVSPSNLMKLVSSLGKKLS